VHRDANSIHHLLLEIWVESRQITDAAPIVRARARDLDTGRQQYVKSRAELDAFIAESLTSAGDEHWKWQGEEG
jgi:hypothetical protein